jgi:hypothetical protein
MTNDSLAVEAGDEHPGRPNPLDDALRVRDHPRPRGLEARMA